MSLEKIPLSLTRDPVEVKTDAIYADKNVMVEKTGRVRLIDVL